MVDPNLQSIDHGNWTEKEEFVSMILKTDPLFLNKTYVNFSSELEVIFIILSAAEEFLIRSEIRQTWANPMNTNVFSTNKNAMLFVVGRQDAYDEKIQQEHALHNDILQIDVEETYLNLVYKLLATYKWATFSFPFAAIVKVDSDVVVRPGHIIDLIKLHSNPNRLQIACKVNYYVRVTRDYHSRWFISNRSYSPVVLPNYCSGPLYIIFPFTFTMLWKEIRHHKVFEVEDAYITGVLAEAAEIQLLDLDNFLINNPRKWNCDPEPAGLLTHEMGVRNIQTVIEKLENYSCLSTWQSVLNFFAT
ncbi:unnamed protein product [Auanema sp. JU1783]|nr:unnamed protein product [Auanema sp. JU1783]